jgi:quinol monooxygenase YgiN
MPSKEVAMSFRRVVTSSLVVLAMLAGWASSGALAQEKENPGQEKEHPIAAQVKAALKDPGRPFTLVVHLKIKEGAAEKFEAAFAKAAQPTRQEKGNRAYDLNRDAQAPTKYLLYERWQDLSALDEHLKTPYITKLLSEVQELQDGPPEVSVLLPAG